jgi:tRNA pseudouridine55 synthase
VKSPAVEISGVVLVDKPVGPTSFDVVRSVKRAFKVKSAGHTGTLDPNASGLLPVCIGDATRIASFVTDGDKTYEGLVRFGITTNTLDSEGEVIAQRDASHLTRESVEKAIATIVGPQAQAAPMFSARRVDGRRLHELAREGIEVEREARTITVYEAQLLSWNGPDALVRFHVSKGTYIRVLAERLGELLDVGAHLAQLRRTASGSLSVKESLPLSQIEELAGTDPASLRQQLRSTDAVLLGLPYLQVRLDERGAASVSFGNPVEATALRSIGIAPRAEGERALLIAPDGSVTAVGEFDSNSRIRLVRVLRAQTGPGHYRGRRPETGSKEP